MAIEFNERIRRIPAYPAAGGSPPAVGGSAGFVVAPDDARGMAGAIISILVEDDLAADLRRQGPEQAAKFNWEHTALETLRVYDRITNQE